ncbi:MAG: cobaltochelatase subunit CobN [Paracoccus sp. (in: a-proteobacteria)]|uniref:cobaltochelatase subunit CobN n=1 Tax=Paracoccus sp. TaxID=267 RepID=UPI0026E07BDD|nr:cobaltochelatase subunit CobN [Paracoccus sp. (in: a-proteobacteria)]MDO5612475.1 cobaltochelatase subunit CobN [Paracoccus sp. (in: a-proteobacteria)]
MHVVFRESHGLEETAVPTDPGQTPADLVVLSYSDSDLGAFAAGWQGSGLPSTRLLNLSVLAHPLSVDTYADTVLAHARAILIRLIGGQSYWAYGLQVVRTLAKERGIALAVLPADGRPDAQLDAASTLPVPMLRALSRLCEAGGAESARAALHLLAGDQVPSPPALADVGGWHPASGVICPSQGVSDGKPLILLVFYRAYLAAADTAPFAALTNELESRGYAVLSLFVPSLKQPQARGWLADWVARLRPAAIINATAFSARDDAGTTPLDGAGVPVFQIALATNDRARWHGAARGLSPADLAMHVVLPEVDGRIFAGVASFKGLAPRDAALEFARAEHRPDPACITAIADRVTGWLRLAAPPVQRRPALILSTYPGKGWNMAHAVGLDAPESARAILRDLAGQGYDVADPGDLSGLASARIAWPLADYRAALAGLPQALRDDLAQIWGAPEDDPDCDGAAFHFAAIPAGRAMVALQPERGRPQARDAEYHDLTRAPRHAYVAFYLWLRARGVDAIIHIGAHGTLEWLPGKSVALSGDCWPQALTGDLPVIYPFIVNDPGEAAQAKRRIGAVTLGHIPPPQVTAGQGAGLWRLESLLDEFSNADGLDPARRDRLQADIRAEAEAVGLATDLALDAATDLTDAITRIDRFVCDVKDSQFGQGLHIYGTAQGEAEGLRAALAGRRVAPGPSGSPHRGRRDVVPTGRNLFSVDPRGVPSRSAHAQGVRLADELVRRHLQDHGDWPRRLIVDLWGSATMRTAGEEFAMALHLIGARPVWDAGSERVSGVEILPVAELDRPRLDVTLRVSGLFRDVFPQLAALFEQAVRALAARDEAPDWNPYARAPGPRVYGPAPGAYGLGMADAAEDYSDAGRAQAGAAWLAASSWPVDAPAPDPDGIAARVAAAQAFVHIQDLPETDLLLAADYAGHEAGFAAAQALTGGQAALYHMDARDPANPRARTLTEEIARVTRARAANPAWLRGMIPHGFRGAAEIAATLEHLAAFAHLAGAVPPHLFDLYHEATLGDPDILAFLEQANPQALAAMRARFAALHQAGLWQTRRNSIIAGLSG